MASQDAFLDISGAVRLLDSMSFDRRSQKNIIQRATRKGGNILKSDVRGQIHGTSFEHISRIRSSVKVVTSRSRVRPGVNVYIKGRDLPVGQGRTRRFWKASSYSRLVFMGNYKSYPRRKRSGASTGNVKGIVNSDPFLIAKKRSGALAVDTTIKSMIPEIQKEILKLKRRL